MFFKNKNKLLNFGPYIAIFPALFLFTVFVMLPALANICFTFTDYSGNIKIPINWVGIDNYKRVVTSDFSDVWYSVKITIILSASSIILQNIIGVFLAILVNKRLKLCNFYRSVIFLPMVLGSVVHGLVWSIMLDPFTGPVNMVLQKFGIKSALLGDVNIVLYLLILIIVWSNVGFNVVIYIAGLQGIPKELYESANIDGAKRRHILKNITLPLLRPAITVNFLITLIGSLHLYDLIIITTGGGPGKATRSLAVYIFQNLVDPLVSQGYTATLSIFQFVIIFILVVISQHFLRRGEVDL